MGTTYKKIRGIQRFAEHFDLTFSMLNCTAAYCDLRGSIHQGRFIQAASTIEGRTGKSQKNNRILGCV
jgi:hypothetical protein